MQTFWVVWFAGAMLAGAVYLALVVRPAYREHAPNSGALIEVLHFGPRVMLVMLLWPLLLVVFAGMWMSERGWP